MDWLEGMMLGKTNQDTYKRIELKRRPAKDRNGIKECVECGCCCWKRPCELVPSDVDKIAAFLEMSVRDLFETLLVVDEIRGDLYIVPIRKSQSDYAGDFLSAENTYDIDTPCIFLEDTGTAGRCTIHKVKPKGGRRHKCWQPGEGDILKWSEEDLEKYFDYIHIGD